MTMLDTPPPPVAPAFGPEGQPAPWFVARSATNPRYHIHTAAGRYLLLVFPGDLASPTAAGALGAVFARHAVFDDARASAFVILHQNAPEGLKDRIPGFRVLVDDDFAAARAYGAAPAGAGGAYRPRAVLVDPQLRILAIAPLSETEGLIAMLTGLPAPHLHAGIEQPTPVLVVPRVFEEAFCQRLIAYYHEQGGEPSGFMREINGMTHAIYDDGHKKRSDAVIHDEALMAAARERVMKRLLPEIKKAFQFQVTRMERYIVACYDGESGGWFRPHRDNTTKGTAHRRFAVTMALNDNFEGGGLRFPEFGPKIWRPPAGSALVFSCSLLHEAAPVTGGQRFAFLPFLYDEAGAKTREENQKFLVGAGDGGG